MMPGETRFQYQERKFRERKARWVVWDYDMERCGRCALAALRRPRE